MLDRFLDPKVLSEISGLELLAKTVVDGFIAGMHRSPDFGFSQEFAEYRAYTEGELKQTLSDMLPRLQGMHYHDVMDPAWFGLIDFKVLLLEKPGGAPKASYTENKGFRWYSQGR